MTDLLVRLKAEGGQQAGSAVDDLRKRMKAMNDEMDAFNIARPHTAAETAFRNRMVDARNRVNELTDDLHIAAIAIDLQADSMDTAAVSTKNLKNATKGLSEEYGDLLVAFKKTQDAHSDLKFVEGSGGKAGGRTGGSIDRQFGQAASGLTGVGQVLGLGDQAAAAAVPLRLGGDIADLAENLPLLSAQFAAMGASAAAAAVPIALIAAPLIAIAGGFYLLNRSLGDEEKHIRDVIRAEDERINSLKQIKTFVETMTAQEISQRRKELESEVANLNLSTEAIIAATNETASGMSSAEFRFSRLKDELGAGGIFEDATDKINKNNEAVGKLVTEYDNLNTALTERAELERLQQIFDDASYSAGKYADELERRAAVEIETGDALVNMSAEQAKQRIESLQRSTTAEAGLIIGLTNEIAKAQAELEAAGSNEEEFKRLSGELEVLQGRLNTATDSVDRDAEALKRWQEEILPVIEARERELKQVNDAAEAIARINKAREEELKKLEKHREEQRKFLDTLDNDIEKANTEAAKHRKEAGRSSQLDLLNQRLEGAKAQEEAIKTQDKIADINSEYMQSELVATQKFQEQESRLTEDHNRDQLRLIDSLNAELLDAARANDVVSFLRAQRKGETALRRGAEDFGTDSGRRTGDFLSERTAARDERLAQLADIRAANQAHLSEVENVEKQIKDMRARFAQEDLQEEQRANARRIQQLRMSRILVANELTMLDNQVTQAARAIAVNASTSFLGQLAASMRAGNTNTNNINVTQNNVVGDVASTRYVNQQAADTVDAIANIVGKATVERLW